MQLGIVAHDAGAAEILLGIVKKKNFYQIYRVLQKKFLKKIL